MKAEGSCLCGGMRYEVDQPVGLLTICHCSMCRKIHGAAFGPYAHFPEGAVFRWVEGEDLLRTFESSPGNHRGFCSRCGSNMPSNWGEGLSVPAGSLDGDIGVEPALHMFVGSKAPWYPITDGKPQFDEWVPGYGPNDV